VPATLYTDDAGARFAIWQPSRRLTLEGARQRSRFIKIWRWICISIAGGAGLLVLGWAVAGTVGGDMGFQSEITAREALKMINPRFTGRAANGAGYVLNAETATRRSRVSEVIDLERPVFTGGYGQTAKAPRGIYRDNARTLELAGGVVFLDKSGNRFDTATTLIEANRDRAVGSGAIQGSGPLGALRADAYEIQASGGHVFLRGNVRGTIKGSAP
jgi:lipopolysaccharide export system protein LptC